MKDNIKNHSKCVFKVVYCYILGVILSWAAYPLLLILYRIFPLNKSMTVYTVFSTLILMAVIYISMHEIGENDRKPYKWLRYKGKGFVCGAIGAVIVNLIGYVVLFAADKLAYIQHPILNIANINSYIKLICYMPFFWFFELTKDGSRLIPEVTYISALITVPVIVLVSGLGYMMGFMGVNIIKKKDGSDFLSKILYRKEE